MTCKTIKWIVLVISFVSLNSEAFAVPVSSQTGSFYLNSLASELSSPKEIAKFMKKNFKFIPDQKLFGKVDHWQTPEEFLNLKKGDCEDYALFSKRLLELKGIEAYVVSIYGRGGYAHTITVYKQNGHYNVINEDRHYKYQKKTIEEALSKVRGDWIWAGIAKQRGTRGWMLRRLQNKTRAAKHGTFRSNFAHYPF